MKFFLLTAAVVMAMTSPAFAKHCPKDVQIIDKALGNAAGLSKMQMSEVKALRDKGNALHQSGNHGESIKALHAAAKILGVEPYKAM